MARRLLAVVAAALAVAACSSVPTGGDATVIRRVPAEGADFPEPRAIRRLPENPPGDATPDEIVGGFLRAQISAEDDHAVARRYLAPDVTWNTGTGTTLYSTRTVGRTTQRGDSATVAVTLDRVGTISPQGEFRPVGRPAGRAVTFRLRKDPVLGWRLAEAPAGVMLDNDELSAAYARTTLYFPDQARQLVPETVFLPATEQRVATVVREMLAGPRAGLAPAVRTAVPAGTELLDPPAVVDRVAVLNFSREIRRAPQETLGALVAQIVWTLTEPGLEVDAVRIDAEGDPLTVPGRPGLRDHRRADWEQYAPMPPTTDRRLFFVRDGAAFALDDAGRFARVADTPPLASVAVNRTGTTLAAVTRPVRGRQALLMVDLVKGQVSRTALTSDRISAPTWEPGSDVVWVAHADGDTQQIAAVPVAPGPTIALVPPLAGRITTLRLSPDGARVAMVTGGSLHVARVERPAIGGRVLADPRPVAPSVAGVTAAAFDGALQLTFAAFARGRPVVFRVDLDGYNLVRVASPDALPGAPVTALTASSRVPTDRIASSGGRLWRRTGGAWAALPGRGSAAAYAG